MDSVWDIIYLRRPSLDYVSPPICEVLFSGSSNPVIILSNFQTGKVTGLEWGGFSGFRLSWNVFPGAICYSIYHIAAGTDVAVLLAECVQPGYELPDPGPGVVIVTPITPDEGEGEPSDPIPVPTPGGGGTSTVTVEAVCQQAGRNSFPGTFMISREIGDTLGNLLVHFTLTGEAVNGVDYDLTPLTATIPNGSEFVIVDIAPIEAVMLPAPATKTVILTLQESLTYAVAFVDTAVLAIRPPYLRITDFGGAQPLWTVSPDAEPSDFCDWDGTWNFLFMPGGTSVYKYQSPNGQVSVGTDGDGNPVPMDEAISGKALYQVTIIGPYAFPTPGTWQLEIISRSGLDSQIVWQGLKQGGDIASPEGTYIGNGAGSDPRATLDIELFP